MRGFFTRWFLPKSNIHKKYYDKQKRIHKSNIISKISKFYHWLFTISLKTLARINDRIPSKNLNVNNNRSSIDLKGSKRGSINRSVNQAADKFTNNSESISIHANEDKLISLQSAYLILKKKDMLIIIKEQLDIIKTELKLLKENHHYKAAHDGQVLIKAIQIGICLYNLSEKKPSDYHNLGKCCQQSIATAKQSPLLNEHHGLMYAINCLLHIITVGIVLAWNKWVSQESNPCSFFNTRIIRSINMLHHDIQHNPQYISVNP